MGSVISVISAETARNRSEAKWKNSLLTRISGEIELGIYGDVYKGSVTICNHNNDLFITETEDKLRKLGYTVTSETKEATGLMAANHKIYISW
ncbi:hypothetical protein LCGC14_2868320 [marine sediment metagenome]|uniref:Uncharacterized protein n=1 Tax=marine sediment metagenome TaxID=412755 RepID=A0A0F9AUV3_9ZZZZ